MAAGDEQSPVFDFTSLDFASMRDDLIRYAQQIFDDEVWTDFNDTNEGTRLIELEAYATDLLSYNQNARVRETVTVSLIRRQNFINIAKSFDFTLKSAQGSTTTLRFGLDPAFLPITIPATFKVSDRNGVIFQPVVSTTVSSGSTLEVSATQGDEIEDEQLGFSNGNPGQTYELARSPLIDDTLTLTVNGVLWSKITNFVEAGPTSTVFKLETDENDITSVIFGDGVNGKVPPSTQEILVTYKVGGGTVGNLPEGTITQLVSSLPGVLTVTNITEAGNGGPRQSLESAKRLLPLSIKANDRAVTLQDYATFAEQEIPGVFRANGVAGKFQAGGSPVLLFVVPNGAGEMSIALGNSIVAFFRNGTASRPAVGLAGKRVIPYTAKYVYLTIEGEAYVIPGQGAEATANRVRTAYLARYGLANADFAEALDVQDAYNTVDPREKQIAGLSRVFLRKFSIKPFSSRYINSPTSGDGTVEAIVATSTVQRREWSITIQSGTSLEYTVLQRRLGTASAVFDTQMVDDQANYTTDELIGCTLQPRPEEQSEVWNITSNSQTGITVSSLSVPSSINGLLTTFAQGDSYVVNKTEPTTGKIIRSRPTSDTAAGSSTVPVDTTVGWAPGDKVLIRDGLNSAVMTVSSVLAGVDITFTTALPFNLTIASGTIDFYWMSADGTVSFAVVNGDGAGGGTSFVAGDKLFVDTYAVTGDIKLRPENFPLLDPADLVVVPIGGVR